MKKNELYVFISLSLVMFIPVPGRLAYGIIMLLLLNIISCIGILFKEAAGYFFEDEMKNVIIAVLLITCCILLRQFVILYNPVLALTLGIAFYMPVLTSFVLGNLYLQTTDTMKQQLAKTMTACGMYTIFGIVFFIIRELLGYGTISVPSHKNVLLELNLLKDNSISYLGSFFASIPGALILLVVCLSIFSLVLKNLEIVETSQGAKNNDSE